MHQRIEKYFFYKKALDIQKDKNVNTSSWTFIKKQVLLLFWLSY